jgi:hypothetical protein
MDRLLRPDLLLTRLCMNIYVALFLALLAGLLATGSA